MSQISIPRIMLAAPKSGSGKTALTCGLLNLLKRRGMNVTSFKCGPDYIDPMFHREVLGLASYNLDTFFTGEELTSQLFVKHGRSSDISVIEGVMGYFDGLGGTEIEASSCHLAQVTDTPVILVVDAKGMSRSVVAMIKGFAEYDTSHHIKGVILNRTSPMMYPLLKELIEKETDIKPLGCIPVSSHVDWSSRHLGLLQPEEISDFKREIDAFSDELEKSLAIDDILALAKSAQPICSASSESEDTGIVFEDLLGKAENSMDDRAFSEGNVAGCRRRIGVAMDPAFTFYYRDNLELLESFGCEIVPFSPLKDQAMPDVDGAIFGGGYPELYLKELSANQSFIDSLRKCDQAGMPILAECGGFMYLQQACQGEDGLSYPMAGLLPGVITKKGRLVRFGYAVFEDEQGRQLKGHEFHYFDSTENGEAWTASKPVRGRSWKCQVVNDHITAGFPHLYYYAAPFFVREFLEKCDSYARQQ